ncbi:MAG: HD domain-containing protein [Caldiserica bacterium]|nr:HD domain-containing protein [Caldisericota bacterium]
MAQDDGELIRLALEQLPDGVVVADAHDRVVALNAQARLIRGARSDASVAFPLLFAGSVTEDVEQGLGALRTGMATEFSVVEGDPSTGRVYEHRCVPVRTQGGMYAGTAVTSHDVTDRQLQNARHEARVSGLQQQVAALQDALQERFVDGMITLVDALEARDRYTCGHSSRVAFMAGKVARRVLGHAADAVEVQLAARLHDIGKVAVPDRLLDKPSSLTPEEVMLMDTHPLVGESILRPIAQLRNVAIIIRNHHERWDGAGYPDGLVGENIPIGSRILALADTFDAMTSQRPYRCSLPAAIAREEIAGHLGTQFDPTIGLTFLDMIGAGEILSEDQIRGEAG